MCLDLEWRWLPWRWTGGRRSRWLKAEIMTERSDGTGRFHGFKSCESCGRAVIRAIHTLRWRRRGQLCNRGWSDFRKATGARRRTLNFMCFGMRHVTPTVPPRGSLNGLGGLPIWSIRLRTEGSLTGKSLCGASRPPRSSCTFRARSARTGESLSEKMARLADAGNIYRLPMASPGSSSGDVFGAGMASAALAISLITRWKSSSPVMGRMTVLRLVPASSVMRRNRPRGFSLSVIVKTFRST